MCHFRTHAPQQTTHTDCNALSNHDGAGENGEGSVRKGQRSKPLASVCQYLRLEPNAISSRASPDPAHLPSQIKHPKQHTGHNGGELGSDTIERVASMNQDSATSEVTVITATARFSALAIGALLAACSGSNRVEGILPGLVSAPPSPAILPQPLYEAQKRSGQTGKRDVRPQEAKQLPQQPPQAPAQQSASAAEE